MYIKMAIELSPIDEPAPTTAPVDAEAAPPKRGRGRPAGSPNKAKVHLPPVAALPEPAASDEPTSEEPTSEPVTEEPEPPVTVDEPAPIEQPTAEEPTIKKKRAVRLPTPHPVVPPVPIPVVPPVSIPVVPERPRPEDLLRQMHLDARQRIGDSFTARRDAWSNQLNAKYKV